MKRLPDVLEKPTLPDHLPASSHWLAGEGAGSWFVFESISQNGTYVVARYAPKGQLECRGFFQSEVPVDLSKDYMVGYPSHCQKITVVQGGKKIRFERMQHP